MKTTFKSEVGTGIAIALGISLAILLAATYRYWWMFLLVFTPLAAYLIFLYQNTRYEINEEALHVTAGFKSRTIPIDKITRITSRYSFYNIPNVYALSEHRLLVSYREDKFVEISPKNREAFIGDLLQRNPNIQVERTAFQR